MKLKSLFTGSRTMRDSSMELLRIVAIFLVLVVHADFVSLGVPEPSFATVEEGTDTLLRVIFEMMAIGCVNIFILISGWFAIRPTVKGFLGFIFQVLYFFLGIYICMQLLPGTRFTADGLAACFCLKQSHWFIKAYAALYLIAPLLNRFAEEATEAVLRRFLILFYLYQTVWGFFSPNSSVYDGYSVFSFIGLYLLARYMRLHYRGSRRNSWLWLYLLMTALLTLSFFTFPSWIKVTAYANPLVVVSALALTMYFTTLKLKPNKAINFIAASSFAAYLLHSAPPAMGVYCKAVLDLYNATPGLLSVLSIASFLVVVYLVAVIADRPRIWLWGKIGGAISQRIEVMFMTATDTAAVVKGEKSVDAKVKMWLAAAAVWCKKRWTSLLAARKRNLHK